MKKLLFTLTLMVSVTSAFAQKVYVNLIAKNLDSSSPYVYLSGAIPSSINVSTYNNPGIGQTLNLLAKEGFVVEQMSVGDNYEAILLSKNTTNTSSRVQRVDSDEDVTEVARYNLQGMPIGKNEKGIQIVVYSNYTTKTIIVE